jgi:hypothetical protein
MQSYQSAILQAMKAYSGNGGKTHHILNHFHTIQKFSDVDLPSVDVFDP